MSDGLKPAIQLRRTLSLPMMTLYGVGTTIGAGIYVLVGKVAGAAGLLAPVSFVLAALLAAFSAFSFAELSSRFPRSAGEAVTPRLVRVGEGHDTRSLRIVAHAYPTVAGRVLDPDGQPEPGFLLQIEWFLGGSTATRTE